MPGRPSDTPSFRPAPLLTVCRSGPNEGQCRAGGRLAGRTSDAAGRCWPAAPRIRPRSHGKPPEPGGTDRGREGEWRGREEWYQPGWRREGEKKEGGGGEEEGGGGKAGGGTEGGVESQHPRSPVDAGVVALQPRKPQHQLEMTKPGDLEGKCLRVNALDTKLGGEIVGDRPGGRNAAID